jgi:hypothetical protein
MTRYRTEQDLEKEHEEVLFSISKEKEKLLEEIRKKEHFKKAEKILKKVKKSP